MIDYAKILTELEEERAACQYVYGGMIPAQREKRLARSGAVALRATGVGGSVQAPIWAGLRTRLALLRFLWLLSRARTADLIGVVVALRCFSFR